MKLTIKLITVLVLLASPLVIIQGCGSNDAVPDGSTITINPSAADLENITSDTPRDFKVVVRYKDGTPIPYAIIHISGAFAEPAVAAPYQFYWYKGGDQVFNTPVDSGFEAQTNEYGFFDFSVVVYGPGSSFHDTIYVTSGTAVGTATIDLTTT